MILIMVEHTVPVVVGEASEFLKSLKEAMLASGRPWLTVLWSKKS